MKIVAVIPCFNEQKTITDIVTRAIQYVDRVIVADDGSTDGTSLAAQKEGVSVVRSISRRGFGGNVVMGISVASSEKADIVVTLDGDGQNNPDEIPQVVELVLRGEADLVIGSRFKNEYTGAFYRKLGICIITWLYNIGHKQKITDGQSCFRAYSRQLLEAVDTKEWGFAFSTEILIKARKQGFRIKEAPISCIYHKEFSRNSSMNPIKQGLMVAVSTIKWRLKIELLKGAS